MHEEFHDEAKKLVGEIFLETGQKVGVDDPIVVVAFLHSKLMRRAGQDAQAAISATVKQAMGDLNQAVQKERQVAADIGKATGNAYAQILSAAKAASDAELPKLRAQFLNVADDVLQQVRKEARMQAPYAWKLKIGLAIAGLVLLGGLSGALIGIAWYKPTADQQRQLATGKDFQRIFPQLDQKTQDKVRQLIEQKSVVPSVENLPKPQKGKK